MLDPNLINISNRQRQEIEIDDHFIASVKSRLINPIILRRDNDEVHLVAGERRLAALKQLGVSPLVENTHYRFFEDLDSTSAYIIELEENIKREDLPWRDQIRAFGALHEILVREANGTPHSVEATAQRANVSRATAYKWHVLARNLDAPILASATSIEQAYAVLQLTAERKAADLVSTFINIGKDLTQNAIPEPGSNQPPDSDPKTDLADPTPDPNPDPSEDNSNPGSKPEADSLLPNQSPPKQQTRSSDRPPDQFVLNLDFLNWASTYSGPKFNLIHVDFPYGIDWESFNEAGKIRTKSDGDYANSADLYDLLLDRFCEHLDRFVSYSAHVVFWFPMDFYESTRTLLEAAGLSVNKYPLIWYKSDNLGIMPGAQTRLYPRRLYETAFLCTRGNRTLVRASGNIYAAPHASSPLHPSHKPEPMLKHFFSMLVDETTDLLDPTCGSGSSLRAANNLGARKVLGLEIDENFAKIAEAATRTAFNLRKLS